MKRKNLFLSLICSIIVAVSMVGFTVYSFVAPTGNDGKNNGTGSNVSVVGDVDPNDNIVIDELINESRDGSEAAPYVLFTPENFVELLAAYGSQKQVKKEAVLEPVMVENELGVLVEKVDANGDVVYTEKLDDQGKVIYQDVVDKDGARVLVPYYFELGKNINFKDFEYVPLFNGDSEFVGIINGNGYKLKNITIDVNADNYENGYAHTSEDGFVAHIGIFGNVKDAVIKDVVITDMKVSVSEEVYSLIESGDLYQEYGVCNEVAVGSVAGFATGATFENVSVEAEVDAFGYAVYVNSKTSGYNAVGGMVAVAKNTEIKGCTVDVDIIADTGFNYCIGGVAAYATGVELSDSSADVDVKSSYAKRFTIGGAFASADSVKVADVSVDFDLTEVVASAQERANYVASLNMIEGDKIVNNAHNNNLAKTAGLIVFINTNGASTIQNVSVISNVDYDALFAGVVMDVYSSNKTNKSLVKFENVSVNSNVNVLAAYGFARQLISSTIVNGDVASASYYNIVLTGKTNLKVYTIAGTTEQNYSAVLFAYNTKSEYITVDLADLHIKVSAEIFAEIGMVDELRANSNVYGKVNF